MLVVVDSMFEFNVKDTHAISCPYHGTWLFNAAPSLRSGFLLVSLLTRLRWDICYSRFEQSSQSIGLGQGILPVTKRKGHLQSDWWKNLGLESIIR